MLLNKTTVAEMLEASVHAQPDKCFHFFHHGGSLSLAEIWNRAGRIATGLQERGVKSGTVVGVLLPTGRDILPAIIGVWRAGGVLAPLSVPMGKSLATYIERLRHVMIDGQIQHVITHPQIAPIMRAQPDALAVATVKELRRHDANPTGVKVQEHALALIQYTSGSTTNPKGVALTQAQVMSGLRGLLHSGQFSADDIYCGWLPLSHDMGLISALGAFPVTREAHFSAPSTFIKEPAAWLRYFAEKKASVYVAPNFSYQYLVDAFTDDEVQSLDLSNLRLAFNGAEPIDPILLERFAEKFAPAGFRPEMWFPVYGLAEATLAVSFPTPGDAPVIEWVNRDLLANELEVELCDRATPNARGLVAVGKPVEGIEFRIVGTRRGPRPNTPEARAEWIGDILPERKVGEIEIRGPGCMSGYYRNPEETAEVEHEGWWRTGDLGYISGGQLFITGRMKEMMILHGENYYPEDIEAIVRELPGLYRRRCIAFVKPGQLPDSEAMAVMCETGFEDSAQQTRLADEVRKVVARDLGITDLEVYLVKPRAIRRTTSGKFQRLLMRERVLANAIGDDLLTKKLWTHAA